MGDNRTYSAKHPENDIHDAHVKSTGLSHVELGFGLVPNRLFSWCGEVGRNSYSEFAILAQQCIAVHPQGGLCE